MNFTILFHLIGNLNFHVQFSLHSHNTQDFFIFQDENSSAHLYRENETVSLYLREEKDFEVYQMHILNELNFSWIGFKVNGIDMKQIKATGGGSSQKIISKNNLVLKCAYCHVV